MINLPSYTAEIAVWTKIHLNKTRILTCILKHLNGSKVLRAKKFSPKMFESDKLRQLQRVGKSKIRVALSISVLFVWALKMKMVEQPSLEANKKSLQSDWSAKFRAV